jgi:ferritin-like metal-binding protein YciE
MKKKATTDDLKLQLRNILPQTEEHVSRLERVIEICGKKAQAKKCDAMEGLTKKAIQLLKKQKLIQ